MLTAIRWAPVFLWMAGITPHELDHIGISRDPSANPYKKALFALRLPVRSTCLRATHRQTQTGRRPNFDFIRDRLSNMARVRKGKRDKGRREKGEKSLP